MVAPSSLGGILTLFEMIVRRWEEFCKFLRRNWNLMNVFMIVLCWICLLKEIVYLSVMKGKVEEEYGLCWIGCSLIFNS